MVRKSERSKVGAEKVDKPTSSRKPTRSTRRRKKSASDSEPEQDVPAKETAEEIPLPPQPQVTVVADVPEPPKTPGRRGRPRRQQVVEEPQNTAEVSEEPPKASQEWNEDENFWGESSKAEPETKKMDDENSTWKIQSSNGSGGEIQKLKICRQRLTDSAESSSSPAKEIASPRRKRYRKRKDKDRHLPDLDGAESTGSHTDSETPPSTVPPEEQPSVEPSGQVGSTSHQEVQEEIPLPQGEPTTQKPGPAVLEQTSLVVPVPGDEESQNEVIEKKEDEVETQENVHEEKDEPNEALEAAVASIVMPEEIITESVDTVIIEPEADIDLADIPVEATPVEVPEDEKEDTPEKASDPEAAPAPVEQEEVTEAAKMKAPVLEEVSAVEEAPTVEEAPPSDAVLPAETDEVEEGELKPPKKPARNLRLAASNEDAMQQIAKKLNERAARFSKEATEEAARRSTPHKSVRGVAVEEEEEEGEISRDPSSTKTLELKRLSDDDVEPANTRRERKRRAVTAASPLTPSSAPKENELEVAKQQDVSTELLLNYVPDVIEPISEEEVQSILAPKEDELEVRDVPSDVDSVGEAGEIVEEEGELVEDNKEGRRRSVEDRRAKRGSDEPKRTERRVTKEPKDGARKSSRKERRPSDDEPRAKKKYEKDDKDKKSPSKHKAAERVEKPEIPKPEENHKIVRKIAIISDDTKPIRRSLSPPTKKASCILFITNLVRPFTIGQLKELLNRTGTISPNGFYIDKIKSKCFVKYNDVEMAIETRHALHGVRWPVTNPRTLRVEFSTDEAMETVKKQAEDEDNAAKKQDLVAQNFDKGWLTEKDIVKPPRKPQNLVRPWDMGKDVNEVATVNEVKKGKEDDWGVKAKDKTKEDGRRRPISPSKDKSEPAKKIKRRDTEAPAKLLDDLFRKTNSTPCIYWLPLTAAQIAVKEEMRRQHMAEHQKRLAELRKSETSRRDKDKSRDRDRERERARERRRK
uniref:Apoptotic chromatin condensation inducer in the nucleus n=1 Tax=Lygus hesperus TaxID=30085 RepID=A0A0A9ZBN2_LYGHE